MNNQQALGYMLVACKELGFDKAIARRLYGEMHYQFDVKTEEEAKEIGHDWYHSLED